MKDHVEIGHLIKYDVLGVNRDQVLDLETRFKIHTNVSNFQKRAPKPYKLLIFYQFCDNCKIPSCTYYLNEAEMKISMFAHFKEFHENHKNCKIFYDFGGRCLKNRDACMDFELYFKAHNLVSVHSKSIILGQMTNLNTIFYVVVSVDRFVKTRNSPQFPAEFRNGQ